MSEIESMYLSSIFGDMLCHSKKRFARDRRSHQSHGDFRIADRCTEDFRFISPTEPDWLVGHVGAKKLLEPFKMLAPPVTFAILDMIEEGDAVAVRWQLSATHDGKPLHRDDGHLPLSSTAASPKIGAFRPRANGRTA
jgi:SnoaL-like domain